VEAAADKDLKIEKKVIVPTTEGMVVADVQSTEGELLTVLYKVRGTKFTLTEQKEKFKMLLVEYTNGSETKVHKLKEAQWEQALEANAVDNDREIIFKVID
jgi:hypothetical protein